MNSSANSLPIRFSAIAGALELRRFCVAHQHLTESEAIEELRRGPSSASALDYDEGLRILQCLEPELFLPSDNRTDKLRGILKEMISVSAPLWANLSIWGRDKARLSMDDDTIQCMEYAELFGSSDEAVQWWDDLQMTVRRADFAARLGTGRQGERQTLIYETERLASLGRPDLHPVWVAIEDNSAGYDVRSYELTPRGEVENLFIEAKASNGTAFFVSRAEWRFASTNVERFRLYFWNLETSELRAFRAINLQPHIPLDQGIGRWDTIRIDVADIDAFNKRRAQEAQAD